MKFYVTTMVVLALLQTGAKLVQAIDGFDPDRTIGFLDIAIPFGFALWGLVVLIA